MDAVLYDLTIAKSYSFTYVSKMSPRMLVLPKMSPSKCLILDEIRRLQEHYCSLTYSMHYASDMQ
jgi:hypothetical protein